MIFRSAWLNRTLEFCGLHDGRLQLSILQDTMSIALRTVQVLRMSNFDFLRGLRGPIDDPVNPNIMYTSSRFHTIFENLYNRRLSNLGL